MTARGFSHLFRIDLKTGEAMEVGPLGSPSFESIAWDGEALYGLNRADDSLYAIDGTTGAATLIGPVSPIVIRFGSGLTADRRGRLWGLNGSGQIFRVDKTTGSGTAIATTGFGFDSIAIDAYVDSDDDGMPDHWEVCHGLDPDDPSDAAEDLDGDGLNNLDEFTVESNPTETDTDGDHVSDGDEVNQYGTDPVHVDSDRDGLWDGSEILSFETDPLSDDTDGDGMPDFFEIESKLYPRFDDASDDPDGDGAVNLDEFTGESDPKDFWSRPLKVDAFALSNSNVLHRLDLRSGSVSVVGALGGSTEYSGLAMAPDHSLYTIDFDSDQLVRIDAETAVPSVVGPLGIQPDPLSISFDARGRLWLLDQSSRGLYRIDLESGEASYRARLDPPSASIYGVAWDVDTLYGLESGEDTLNTIDPDSGTTEVVGPLVHVNANRGLDFTIDVRRGLWGIATVGRSFGSTRTPVPLRCPRKRATTSSASRSTSSAMTTAMACRISGKI
jgi:hypothetical protein